MKLTPLKDTSYASFLEESLIILDIPEVEKTEADEDNDVKFLNKVRRGSSDLKCIPLPHWEPVPPPSCSSCTREGSLTSHHKEASTSFISFSIRTFSDEAFSSSINASTSKTLWWSSFDWYLDDVLEIDWSKVRKLELI